MHKRKRTLLFTTSLLTTAIASSWFAPAFADRADATLIWAAISASLEDEAEEPPEEPPEEERPFMKGAECSVGDPDCNACANDVKGAFARFKNSKGRDFEYTFSLTKKYAPSNNMPATLFTIGPADGGHLQTFTRLSLEGAASNRAWFAATYGSGRDGGSSMYLVSAPIDGSGAVSGEGRLEYIYGTKDKHPGGSQGLGKYLFVAHDEGGAGGYVEVFDLNNPKSGTRTYKPTAENRRVAAVGAAKLENGGTLAVTKRSGDGNKTYDFYYADSPANNVPGWTHIGEANGQEQVENVSLVTECGSSDVYMVTATGDGDLVYKDNYWKLYRVEMEGASPKLVHLDSVRKAQESNCDARAAGTAYASWDHNLAFYCAQKLASDQRVEAKECLAPPGFNCSGFLDCLKDVAKDVAINLGVPAGFLIDRSKCARVLAMDDHMSFRQYW